MSAVSFVELKESVGLQAAADLCDEFGGTTITVPARPKATHPLARALGLEAVRRLYATFGAQRLSLPLGPNRGQAGRRAHAARLINAGWSVSEAARMADMHERTAWYIKRDINSADAPLLDRLPADAQGRGRLPGDKTD